MPCGEVLIKADEKFGSAQLANPDCISGIQELRSWKYELAADSRAALKYAYWCIQLIEEGDTPFRQKMSVGESSGELFLRAPALPGTKKFPYGIGTRDTRILSPNFTFGGAHLRRLPPIADGVHPGVGAQQQPVPDQGRRG